MTSTEIEPLSQPEATALDNAEMAITAGMKVFVKVGLALAEIRDRRLYRTQYDTFEAYCQSRWGWSASRGRQLIGAAEVAETVTSGNAPVPNERQARELVGLEPEKATKVWTTAVENTAGKPTAKVVSEVRAEVAPEVVESPSGTVGEIVSEGAPEPDDEDILEYDSNDAVTAIEHEMMRLHWAMMAGVDVDPINQYLTAELLKLTAQVGRLRIAAGDPYEPMIAELAQQYGLIPGVIEGDIQMIRYRSRKNITDPEVIRKRIIAKRNEIRLVGGE